MIKKILLTLVSLAIIAAGVQSFQQKRQDEKAMEAEMSAIQLQIDELKLEKADLTNQLSEFEVEEIEEEERAEHRTISLLPQFAFAFTNPQNYLYEDVYPAMQEIALTGVLVFADGSLPGEQEGDLSAKRVDNMVSEGWRVALSVSGKLNLSSSEDTVIDTFKEEMLEYKTKMKAITYTEPEICYFPEGTYRSYLADVITELGFTTVICENAENSDLHNNSAVVTAYGHTKLDAFFEADECERKQFLLFDMSANAKSENAYSTKSFNTYLTSMLEEEEQNGMLLRSVDELLSKPREKEQEDEDEVKVTLSEAEILLRIQEIDDEIYALYH